MNHVNEILDFEGILGDIAGAVGSGLGTVIGGPAGTLVGGMAGKALGGSLEGGKKGKRIKSKVSPQKMMKLFSKLKSGKITEDEFKKAVGVPVEEILSNEAISNVSSTLDFDEVIDSINDNKALLLEIVNVIASSKDKESKKALIGNIVSKVSKGNSKEIKGIKNLIKKQLAKETINAKHKKNLASKKAKLKKQNKEKANDKILRQTAASQKKIFKQIADIRNLLKSSFKKDSAIKRSFGIANV